MFGLKTEISNLLKVQEIDSEIDKNKRLITNAPERTDIAELGTEINDLDKLKTRLQENCDKEKQILKKDNDELEILAQKIKKEEQKLFSGNISNPKELAAIQQEVSALNNRRDELETTALEQMDKVANLEKKMSVVSAKLNEANTKVEQLQASLSQKEKEIGSTLEDLSVKREEMAKTVDSELMEDYEDIRQRKDGVGAAALIKGICQACHVEVPETELEEIINSDRPDYCPSCGRLLIVQ